MTLVCSPMEVLFVATGTTDPSEHPYRCMLNLTNTNSSASAVYRVRLTRQERYAIKHSKGTLPPGQQTTCVLFLRGPVDSETPPFTNDELKKDKFMVEFGHVSSPVSDIPAYFAQCKGNTMMLESIGVALQGQQSTTSTPSKPPPPAQGTSSQEKPERPTKPASPKKPSPSRNAQGKKPPAQPAGATAEPVAPATVTPTTLSHGVSPHAVTNHTPKSAPLAHVSSATADETTVNLEEHCERSDIRADEATHRGDLCRAFLKKTVACYVTLHTTYTKEMHNVANARARLKESMMENLMTTELIDALTHLQPSLKY